MHPIVIIEDQQYECENVTLRLSNRGGLYEELTVQHLGVGHADLQPVWEATDELLVEVPLWSLSLRCRVLVAQGSTVTFWINHEATTGQQMRLQTPGQI